MCPIGVRPERGTREAAGTVRAVLMSQGSGVVNLSRG